MFIRPEQFKVFEEQAEAEFVEEVVEHLLDEYPDVDVRLPSQALKLEEISRPVLRKLVRCALARARGYGMSWESSLVSFVSLMFVVAPNFDEHPLVRRVLRDETSGPNARIDLLWEEVSDETWDAVELDYDPKAWNADPRKP